MTLIGQDLLDGQVDQVVAVGAAQWQAETVERAQGSAEETEEADLLAVLQPVVQPVGEALVLGAAAQLQGSCRHAGQIHQRQQHVGHAGQCCVDHEHRELVELVLALLQVGLQHIPDKVVGVEDEEPQGQEGRHLPVGKRHRGMASTSWAEARDPMSTGVKPMALTISKIVRLASGWSLHMGTCLFPSLGPDCRSRQRLH